MSGGNHAGPSGKKKTASSTKASTFAPLRAESATMASQVMRASAASRWAAICSGVAMSVLESTQMRRALQAATCLATHSSPRPIGWEASITMATTSMSCRPLSADSLSSSPRASWGLWIPGVSTRMSWKSSRVKTARKRWRVVWAVEDVMAIFLPMMAFKSVDLPAFGRPTRVAKPDLKPSFCIPSTAILRSWG